MRHNSVSTHVFFSPCSGAPLFCNSALLLLVKFPRNTKSESRSEVFEFEIIDEKFPEEVQ
ncbi:hypothetical protein K491DRAFT_699187 [Lophiostoma macrostomum CBS 122681]|uniref:Uncharacterized protein n=1 Tax=Lophiostoma macrostomum CBS 122681 TaxID=1314788 RepID=A0A6A6SM82_9PLEO|nr:hypothetical protein K491DRAFT_699187 [Lophiostoma macrostomum CBS 122681]